MYYHILQFNQQSSSHFQITNSNSIQFNPSGDGAYPTIQAKKLHLSIHSQTQVGMARIPRSKLYSFTCPKHIASNRHIAHAFQNIINQYHSNKNISDTASFPPQWKIFKKDRGYDTHLMLSFQQNFTKLHEQTKQINTQ